MDLHLLHRDALLHLLLPMHPSYPDLEEGRPREEVLYKSELDRLAHIGTWDLEPCKEDTEDGGSPECRRSLADNQRR